MLRSVISGGQTGVDRAGLDAAVVAGFQTGQTLTSTLTNLVHLLVVLQ